MAAEDRIAPAEQHRFADDGATPNNALPLLVYRGIPLEAGDPAASLEQLFAENGWSHSWRNGIFPYHHYHSKTHEVLGIARGRATVRFGGEHGADVEVKAGDVVVIPAGVGHKREQASDDFLVVGAYPHGSDYDLIRSAERDKHHEALARIAKVPLPEKDPVAGAGGPLREIWTEANSGR